MFTRYVFLACLVFASACGGSSDEPESCGPWVGAPANLGASLDGAGCRVAFRTVSHNATRVEVWLYSDPLGDAVATAQMERTDDGIWSVELESNQIPGGLEGPLYYGYRAWGPNWLYDGDWEPGSGLGFKEDVDNQGNRFNPNKLLLDPYARESSHDPGTEMSLYATGPDYRNTDTGPVGPKGLVLASEETPSWERPSGERKNEVVYEVHVRGLTKNDASIPEEYRGTYRGAALKAAYLRELGVTAVEFLPVHETNNGFNGEIEGRAQANYWGYASLSFFAVERRYSSDQSPGGATREFREMVAAFHEEGIRVLIDVVYNHTAEGDPWDTEGRTVNLLSWRGLDSASYYQLGASGREFRNDNGVGPNLAAAGDVAANMVVDSLRYWHEDMGVDGFRFDLATILGNECEERCFNFDAENSLLGRIGVELSTALLIAEPWSISDYQLGNFLSPWSEWNDSYRDTMRRHINKEGVDAITPRQVIAAWSGTSDRFSDDGRSPQDSINFVVAHDGFTLRDLFACNEKQNDQEWPYGPSPGGSNNNNSWDHGGDEALQRQAARTAMALLMVSPGTPMITGGDEFLRSQRCNNNPFNLDNEANWLDWQQAAAGPGAAFSDFMRDLLRLRRMQPALTPSEYWTQSDATWLSDAGVVADDAYLDNAGNRFIALRLAGQAGGGSPELYIPYNGATVDITATVPAPPPGHQWVQVIDTSAGSEAGGNSQLERVLGSQSVFIPARSLSVILARPL